jgi:hypothetical protein
MPGDFLIRRIEIYSLRVVPKWLSGKPQGWNSKSTAHFDEFVIISILAFDYC